MPAGPAHPYAHTQQDDQLASIWTSGSLTRCPNQNTQSTNANDPGIEASMGRSPFTHSPGNQQQKTDSSKHRLQRSGHPHVRTDPFNAHDIPKLSTVITLTLQKKLRHQGVKPHAQGCRWSQAWGPGRLINRQQCLPSSLRELWNMFICKAAL